MPQASLLAWLNKPASVKELPPPPPAHLSHAKTTTANHSTASELDSPTLILSSTDLQNNQPETTQSKPTPQENSRSGDARNGSSLRHVELRRCEKADIPAFKRLNSLLLQIAYPESFYREIIEDKTTNNLTLLAFWHDDPDHLQGDDNKTRLVGAIQGRLVGAIRCRLLAHPPCPSEISKTHDQSRKGPILYLSTLVVLSPYRGHGIATALLDVMTRRAVREHGVTSVGAHVWEANNEGLEWYRKRGFREIGRDQAYYRRLNPQGAVVVQRDVRVADLMAERLIADPQVG